MPSARFECPVCKRIWIYDSRTSVLRKLFYALCAVVFKTNYIQFEWYLYILKDTLKIDSFSNLTHNTPCISPQTRDKWRNCQRSAVHCAITGTRRVKKLTFIFHHCTHFAFIYCTSSILVDLFLRLPSSSETTYYLVVVRVFILI